MGGYGVGILQGTLAPPDLSGVSPIPSLTPAANGMKTRTQISSAPAITSSPNKCEPMPSAPGTRPGRFEIRPSAHEYDAIRIHLVFEFARRPSTTVSLLVLVLVNAVRIDGRTIRNYCPPLRSSPWGFTRRKPIRWMQGRQTGADRCPRFSDREGARLLSLRTRHPKTFPSEAILWLSVNRLPRRVRCWRTSPAIRENWAKVRASLN